MFRSDAGKLSLILLMTPFFSTSAIAARHSPSRPLKTSSSSPAFSRMTWVR